MTVKKTILAFIIALSCQTSWAQSAQSLYRSFKDIKGVENVFLPHIVFTAIKNIGGIDPETRTLLSHIRSIRVMNLEECNDDVRQHFLKKTELLNTSGYQELVRTHSDDEHSLVLLKMKDEKIKELVVLNAEPKECSMVIIKCNITPEVVQKLLDVAGKGNINIKNNK